MSRLIPRRQTATGSTSAHASDVWQLFLDVVVVAVVAMEGYRMAQAGTFDAVTLALLFVAFAAAMLRRRGPGWALVLTAAFTVLLPLQTGQNLPAWCLLQVCLASFAILRPRAPAVAATTGVGLLLVLESFLRLHISAFDPLTLALVAWAAAAGGVGSAVRAQRQYVQALEEQASTLVIAREAVVARRIAEERMRIARELHDVLAHHIAAISVHAGSAEANRLSDPGSALESFAHIRISSGEVLRELQAILHVLRSEKPDADPEKPVAGTAQLPRLLETFRALGLLVDYRADGPIPPDLPPALDLALYRIIQEALTNVHKHGTGSAWLELKTTNTEITLKIWNDAVSADATQHNSKPDGHQGFGIIGMHELAASADGELRVTTDAGRFIILGTFPLRAER